MFERFTPSRLATITIIDGFLQARGTHGPFPPPIAPLTARLVARATGGGEAPLDPPIVLRSITRGWGVFVFPDEGIVGTNLAMRIPPDRYRLTIASDIYQTDSRLIDWPTDPSAMPVVVLMPGYAYPFPDLTIVSNQLTLVRGSVMASGAATPIEGAIVSINNPQPPNAWPFASCVTGMTGGWVLAAMPLGVGSPAFDATLHFVLPDGSAFDIAPLRINPGLDNSLPPTALRGSVLSTSGAPMANATITLAGIAGKSKTDANGDWMFNLSPTQRAARAVITATLPSGRNQSQNVQIQERTTVFVPPFRIATT